MKSRFELTLHSLEDASLVLPILRQLHVEAINLTHIQERHNLEEIVHFLEKEGSITDIHIHLSLKHQSTAPLPKSASGVLLVSGIPRPDQDTLFALAHLPAPFPPVYVAYNPYHQEPLLQTEEDARLAQKLDYAQVKGVYLQIGDNPQMALTGIRYIQSLGSNLEIIGSLLIPTPYSLNLLEMGKIEGTNLSPTLPKTLALLQLYQQEGVVPLVQLLPFRNSSLVYLQPFAQQLDLPL